MFTIDMNQDAWAFEMMRLQLSVRIELYPRVREEKKANAPVNETCYCNDAETSTVVFGLPEEITSETLSPSAGGEAVSESVFGRLT